MIVLFIVVWIIIILTLLLIMYAAALNYQYNYLINYPVKRCHNDWLCKKVINDEIVEVNMTDKTLYSSSSVEKNFTPLNPFTINSFTYVNQNGELVTENPSKHINTWSTNLNCSSNDNYKYCPFYKIGDIYWRACYNNIKGNEYNNYEKTYFE